MRDRRIHRILFVVVALIALFVLAACAPPPPSASLSPAGNDVFAKHWVYRSAHGIPVLGLDDGATANAQFHAERLAGGSRDCSNLWHSREMGSWYAGYAWGENIACVPGCPNDATMAWNMWLSSPPHLANIENPVFERIGVGEACNGAVQMVVTHFRSP
jgi:uncharacterized protein YkwD